MRSLLDTCVVSEIRLPHGDAGVKAIVRQIGAADLYLSVLVVGEIVKGIAILPSSKRKSALSDWLAGLERQFAGRILPIDLETGRIWGEIMGKAQKRGIKLHNADALLAATALRHGMHVITRNTKDFQATGAAIMDPWQTP